MKLPTQVSLASKWEVARAQVMKVLGDHAVEMNSKLTVVATADLPAANDGMNPVLLVEDAGAGDRNLILYVGGERFRIDGGTAF